MTLGLNSQCRFLIGNARQSSQSEVSVGERVQMLASRVLGNQLQRFCYDGKLDMALDVLTLMDQKGAIPTVNMYSWLLKACGKRKDLAQAKRVQAHLAKHGLECTRFLGEFLVSTLVKCGGLQDAMLIFRRLPWRSVFSWTAIISGCTVAGKFQDALRLYDCMREEGLEPDTYTFVSLLRACGNLADIQQGKRVHAEALKYGCASDMFVGTCLVDMYGKCGSIPNAQKVFNGLSQPDVVAWTAMLAAFAQQNRGEDVLQLYEQMRQEGVSPDIRIYVLVLQACGMIAVEEEDFEKGHSSAIKSLARGKVVHADTRRKGYDSDAFIGSSLVCLYAKCGSIRDAQHVFDALLYRDVVAWTSMLAAYTQKGQAEEALHLYGQMCDRSITVNDRTYVSVLQACSILAEEEEETLVDGQPTKVWSLDKGKKIHAEAWKKGYDFDVFVGNTLICMYGKCGSIVDAEGAFGQLLKRDVVSWTAMIAAYTLSGQPENALQTYEQMRVEGLTPNGVTLVSLLQACSLLADKEEKLELDGQSIMVKSLEKGKALHADAERNGWVSNLAVGNTIVSMYGKCGSIVDAQHVFDRLSHQGVVSWTALVAAYARQGHEENALQLYRQMQEKGVSPNEITAMCILQACSNAGGLDLCRKIHHTLISSRTELSLLFATALIHAYGRCSSMVEARSVFNSLSQPDVVTWTALIAGYARQGDYNASFACFKEMGSMGLKPNGVTFLSLLSACSHAGLLDEGVQCFTSMIGEHRISPQVEHYASMVDILGRAGHFTEVQDLLRTMPMQPNLSIWISLLGACRKHCKVALGEEAFHCAVDLNPKHAPAYVLMWNIYADAGLWGRANKVNERRLNLGAWRKPGESWVEYEQQLHSFAVEDWQHPEHNQVYALLGRVGMQLIKGEFVPKTHRGVADFEELEVESSCWDSGHPAVPFHLHYTPHEMPLCMV